MAERNEDGSKRRTIRKIEDAKGMSITSLLDILTIILAFLIKNASVEMVQKFTKPPDMKLPETVVSEQLVEGGYALVIKVFDNNKGIVVGNDNIAFGNREGIIGDPNDPSAPATRSLWEYMKFQYSEIKEQKEGTVPCILVQADYNIPCKYITQLVWLTVAAQVDGSATGFSKIYFSSMQDEKWKENSTTVAMN